jgi:hypothetical protein
MPIPPSMMFDQFLDWERQQEFKRGLVDARPLAIAGGSMAHSVIQVNLIAATAPKLHGSGGRPFASDMLVRTDTERGRDLDMTIRYGPLRGEDRVAPNSKLVSGMLFEHTQRQDRTVKLADYNAPPSIAHYVLIEQSEPDVMCVAAARMTTSPCIRRRSRGWRRWWSCRPSGSLWQWTRSRKRSNCTKLGMAGKWTSGSSRRAPFYHRLLFRVHHAPCPVVSNGTGATAP